MYSVCRDMALHESKFQGWSTNATGSPISHFSRSFVLYFPSILLSFSLTRIRPRIHWRVSFLATSFSLPHPARVHQHNNEIILGSSAIPASLSRNALHSPILHECRRICTYLELDYGQQPVHEFMTRIYAHTVRGFDCH